MAQSKSFSGAVGPLSVDGGSRLVAEMVRFASSTAAAWLQEASRRKTRLQKRRIPRHLCDTHIPRNEAPGFRFDGEAGRKLPVRSGEATCM